MAQDYAEAAKWYQKAAQQGIAMAQLSLGGLYEIGQGVSKDITQAAKWYQKAAEQGNQDAQYSLGMLYMAGQGIPKDQQKAAFWLGKAAAQGDSMAQAMLQTLDVKSSTTTGNAAVSPCLALVEQGQFKKAFKCLEPLAEVGDAEAQDKLGMLYIGGAGVRQDEKKGAKWLRMAADQGYAEAQYNLGCA